LEALFRLLLPKNTIQQIKYFTALVSARPNDPSQPQRQQLYLRALGTLPKVSVHLGHFLVHDAHMNRFDAGVVVSNDSDLLGPIKIVRNELGKIVGVLNPQKNPSRAILPHIDFIKQIRSGTLSASQFPN
jgi:hypothetical protein